MATSSSQELPPVEARESLRLDVEIHHPSNYRRRLYLVMALCLIILAYLASLNYWQYLVIVVSAVLAGLGSWWVNQPLLHLTQPKLTRSLYSDWLLLTDAIHGTELWRGQLLGVQDFSWAIVLRFQVTHPQYRRVSHAIYRDQVSLQDWHQLKVLAQVVI